MNRLFWGIALLVSVAAGGWAQSTWRGQAEVWATPDAPTEGYVAASNEFPKNSLLSIENYKSHKTVQVRVVAVLPSGSSALVLLNAKASLALDIKKGEIPLVGVRLEPSGVDRADNPDPDVNPLANRAAGVPATAAPISTPPSAVTPTAPVATVIPAATPTTVPVAQDTVARTPTNSLEVARGSTALDPDLLPLPALAEPETVAEPSSTAAPLAVATDSEPETPVTPGRKVFVTTRNPEPVTTETPVEETPAEPATEAPAETPVETPVDTTPVATTPVDTPVEEAPVAEAPVPAPVEAPVAEVPQPAAPEPVEAAPVEAPTKVPEPAAAVAASKVVAPSKPSPDAWVAAPGKLEGPILGSVSLLTSLEKGRSYVQVGAWATEAEVMTALGKVTSYVPLSLYRAEGEKNPWRVVVSAAPKAQLGMLLMHYRSQGFRSAALVKG